MVGLHSVAGPALHLSVHITKPFLLIQTTLQIKVNYGVDNELCVWYEKIANVKSVMCAMM